MSDDPLAGMDLRGFLFAVPGLFRHVVMKEQCKKALTLGQVLEYGDIVHSRRKRTPMNVDNLVAMWTDNIVRLCVSHEKEEVDRADFQADELLGPILTAPVAQLREFCVKLSAALRAEPRVPWLIWAGFDNWCNAILDKCIDSGAIELKTKLAQEVAQLAEKNLGHSDWIAAIASALQWRSPESLEAVKAELKKGAKPRLVGRESCLFLEVGEAMVCL